MANEPRLREGSVADLALVEPLWVAVHHRHAQSMPQLAPYVSDAETGSGLGSVLLDRLETHLRARGAPDLILGVLAGNDDAIRLYERRGYRPTWLYTTKFEGRR
jgi:GNAT superfamily N-acetyltransferase